MKFSVFTVMVPDLNLEETVAALKRHGYDGVEWRVTSLDPARRNEKPSYWGNNRSTVPEDATEAELKEIRRMTEEAGLEVPNLGCYLPFGDLAAAERGMKIAKMLGSPAIRVAVPGYNRTKTYPELFREARAYLEGVERLCGVYGVKGLIEIHMGNIAPSASMARRLVEGFDSTRIGVIYDPGNMVYEGYEQYRMGLQLLGEYLAHVHVKNAYWIRNPDRKSDLDPQWKAVSAPMRDGIVHWKQVLDDLKSVGYDGWLSFEDFSGSRPTDELLADNLAYIKSLL
mgnify:CR=1 FL=1